MKNLGFEFILKINLIKRHTGPQNLASFKSALTKHMQLCGGLREGNFTAHSDSSDSPETLKHESLVKSCTSFRLLLLRYCTQTIAVGNPLVQLTEQIIKKKSGEVNIFFYILF